MTIALFIAAILLQLVIVLLVFLSGTSRTIGSVVVIVAALLAAYLQPWSLLLGAPLIALCLVLLLPPLRQAMITKPVFNALAKAMPSMSDTEREALDTGTSWWEKELFMGAPNWKTFSEYSYPTLSEEEQSFIDNEVEQLCEMLDEWDIQHTHKALPAHAWQFIKDNGFLGLIIPKEYGGRAFTPYAQSRVMSKIASRSVTAAVSCMVPNSLGPGELLMHYGTDEQKQRWLPGLAKGIEIPCFGLTGPEAGSDAGAIPDTGVVCYGDYEGEQVLGLNMTFSKRWITLAPIATVVGLAFKLYDPDGLLGDSNKSDYGITCALIPASHEGIITGARHYPSGSPFMNGTVDGKDVFIPMDFIIGGQDNIGKGWRMLMACLGVGRGISLPALSTAAGEINYLNVSAFAKLREQFKVSVGHFEGVQEATSDIAQSTYMLEAFRHLVTCGLNEGGTPSVMTAMAKYYATETMRNVVNDSMDVVGGRAIQMGPRNFLAFFYQAIPVSITVEGANILTRSLMIFGQGAMRCHPYLYDELQLLQSDDKAAAQAEFDTIFYKHLGHTFNRSARAFIAGYFGGSSKAPKFADAFTRPYYKRINRFSADFALTADMALGLLAGDLKRKEMLSGRLADIHSHLFIATAILQFYAHGTRSKSEQLHAKLALDNSLYCIQEAFFDLFANFPNRFAAGIVKLVTFPTGRVIDKPSDELKQQLGEVMMQSGEDNPFREQLKSLVHFSLDSDDASGRMQNAYEIMLSMEPLWRRFKKAEYKGEFVGLTFEDHIVDAIQKQFITDEEAEQLIAFNGLRYDAMLTDVFDGELLYPQPRYNPHTLENAADNLTSFVSTQEAPTAAPTDDDAFADADSSTEDTTADSFTSDNSTADSASAQQSDASLTNPAQSSNLNKEKPSTADTDSSTDAAQGTKDSSSAANAALPKPKEKALLTNEHADQKSLSYQQDKAPQDTRLDDYRQQDAENMLNERMRRNHSQNQSESLQETTSADTLGDTNSDTANTNDTPNKIDEKSS